MPHVKSMLMYIQ